MKKFGKFMVFTSIAAAGAAAVLYLKKKFVDDPVDEDVFDEDSEDEACSNCDCQKEETVEPSDTVEENGQEDSPAEEDSQEEEEEK